MAPHTLTPGRVTANEHGAATNGVAGRLHQDPVGLINGSITVPHHTTSVYGTTSHLCKSAVHAGVILDRFGGPVTLEKHSGLGQCKAVRANGILSNCSSGPLSESFFTFVTSDCNSQTILQPHVTSSWEKNAFEGSPADQPSKDSSTISPTADPNATHWLQLELGERKRITGILTKGSNSSDSYVRSYKVLYQDRKGRWRTYTLNNGSDDTVIEGNVDSLYQSRNTFRPAITARTLRIVPLRWHQGISLTVELLGCPYVKATAVVSTSSQVTLEVVPTGPKAPVEKEGGTETVPLQTDPVKLVIIVVSTVLSVGLLLLGICLCKVLHKKKTKNNSYDSPDQPHTGCWKQIKSPSARQQSTEFTFSYNSEKDPLPKMDLVISDMADYQQPLMLGVGTVSRKGSTFRPMDTDPKDEVNAMHYDYLHTTNQYALPLTNQEPEYATPIIERHAFRTDGFLPDPSYSVPGVVLSKSPSFKTKDNSNYRRVGDGVTVGYQTPQVKADRVNHSEGVYDSPKIRQPSVVQNGVSAEYQRPQVKTRAPEIYSTPRDRVRLDSAAPCRPDPGGSSLSGT
ncbi:discoidin, CUB and LCCL domain-containing protein 1 [Hoplias malabaricus]|uniref:discoidin, CUB and LCCL domain-containing protein 1 n=1 Tax=Hoplias malabaricus TaxID=27720 RepID=UPI0034627A89